MSSFRAHAGQTFLHQGQELYVADCGTGTCSAEAIKCAMATGNGCMAVGALKVPSCEGVIFVTRQQYLEMKLLGETR